MKIKVFRFEVSNWTSSPMSRDVGSERFKTSQDELISEEVIENTINKFINGKLVESISVNTIDIEYHNNGRGNTIHLIYTISYK